MILTKAGIDLTKRARELTKNEVEPVMTVRQNQSMPIQDHRLILRRM
jgi:ribosomal protein S13